MSFLSKRKADIKPKFYLPFYVDFIFCGICFIRISILQFYFCIVV